MKCIRNNWFGQKDASKCMLFPKFCHNGNHELNSIQSVPILYLTETTCSGISLGFEILLLCSKALSPTNLERQNANLVLQIFNEYPIQGLLT